MLITDLSLKLPKLENPIIKRAGSREREERKRGKKEGRGRDRQTVKETETERDTHRETINRKGLSLDQK